MQFEKCYKVMRAISYHATRCTLCFIKMCDRTPLLFFLCELCARG